MNILNEIYNLNVDRSILKELDNYKLHKEQAFEGYQELKNQLNEEQAAALDKIMDINLELLEDELEQNFKNGFKLGAKFICEIMS